MTQVFDGTGQQGDVTSNGIVDTPPFIPGPVLDFTTTIEQAPGVGTLIPPPGIAMAGVLRSAKTYGMLLGSSTSDLEVELYRLTAPSTLVNTFGLAKNRTFQDWLNDVGSGSFSLMNDDTDLASIVGDGRDLALFRYRGQAAMMIALDPWEKITRSSGEEAEQMTTWNGRDHLSVLEGGEVYPTGGVARVPIEEDRYFDWKSPAFPISSLAGANVLTTVAGAQVAWASGNTWDAEFPDPTAAVLAPSTATPVTATVGDYYIFQDFTVPDSVTYMLYSLADNIARQHIDGQFIVQVGLATELTAFQETTSEPVKLSTGTHRKATLVTNANLPGGAGANPTGYAWALYRPDGLGGLGTLIAHSDSSAKIIEYPTEPPGMTVGQVMILCLTEMQARGVLTGMTWTFTINADSNGEPWPVVPDIATKVGTDMLSFFRELSTYAELWMRPASLELNAYNIGGRGGPKAVTLTLDTNITSLIHRGEARPLTALLLRYAGGWAERVDAAGLAAYGRVEGTLGIGAVDHVAEVYRIADGQFELFAAPREEIEAGHDPTSDAERPYLVYRPGDTITAPRADGSTSVERVNTLTIMQADETSNVEIIVTLRDVILDAEYRFAQMVKKMNDPSLLGRTKVSQQVSPVI